MRRLEQRPTNLREPRIRKPIVDSMKKLFYGPWDLSIFGLIALILTATGLLATIIPARRATRVDPMVALRYE